MNTSSLWEHYEFDSARMFRVLIPDESLTREKVNEN